MPQKIETKAPVSLVSPATLHTIGAGSLISAPTRAQWKIRRPPFVHDTGTCMLLVKERDDHSYLVMIGRQGMCADTFTEASGDVSRPEDVDAMVLRLWQTGTV